MEGQGNHKKVVEIDILGHLYKVRTDDNEGYIREIADYVNKKIKEVMENTKTVSTVDVVIKAAINIADELFRAREEKTKIISMVEEDSQRIVKSIDRIDAFREIS